MRGARKIDEKAYANGSCESRVSGFVLTRDSEPETRNRASAQMGLFQRPV